MNSGKILYIACENGHDSTVQRLLSPRANFNLRDESGDSPVHIACDNGHNSTVQLLLCHGANFNACDVFGKFLSMKLVMMDMIAPYNFN